MRDLIETREISSLSISPGGGYIAFLVDRKHINTNSTHLTWYTARLGRSPGDVKAIADGGVPIRSYAGPLITQPPTWSPDSRWLYFRARRHREVQVWRASPVTGTVEQVTHDAADVDSFVLAPDGAHLYYEVHATRDAIRQSERRYYRSGIRLSENIDVEEPLLHNWRNDDGTVTTTRLGRNGRYQLLCDGRAGLRVVSLLHLGPGRPADMSEEAVYRTLTHVNQGITRQVASVVKRGQILFPGARGRRVAFWWRRTSGATPWGNFTLTLIQHGHLTPCKARGCLEFSGHFSAPQWRAGTDEIVWLSASEASAGTLYAWNTRQGTVRAIFSSSAHLGGTGGLEHYVETGCPITAADAICVTSDAASPPEIQIINLDSGLRSVLYDPNRQLRTEIASRVRHLTWTDKWGRRHVGVLVLPLSVRKAEPLPLIITGYKCDGFLEGGNSRLVPEFVLAESGFAVLCTDMDFRFAMQSYPGGPVGPGLDLPLLQDMLDAWRSGASNLERTHLIDPTRIGVSGLSFGAEAVWYALMRSRLFSAAVVGGPPVMDTFSYFLEGTAGVNEFSLRGMPLPTASGAAAFYKQASVALNVSAIAAPVLEQSIGNEYREGMETYVEMSKARKPYEVYVFSDETHQRAQPQHIAVIQERTIEWFRFWLQGHEDRSVGKRVQYERWERLCAMLGVEKGGPSTLCVSGSTRKPVRQ